MVCEAAWTNDEYWLCFRFQCICYTYLLLSIAQNLRRNPHEGFAHARLALCCIRAQSDGLSPTPMANLSGSKLPLTGVLA